MAYSLDLTSLESAIAHCKKQIKSIDMAVAETEKQIKQYQGLIDVKTREYDPDALAESIAHYEKTIDNLKQEKSREQNKIADCRKMIETLKLKENLAEGVVIDAEDGSVH